MAITLVVGFCAQANGMEMVPSKRPVIDAVITLFQGEGRHNLELTDKYEITRYQQLTKGSEYESCFVSNAPAWSILRVITTEEPRGYNKNQFDWIFTVPFWIKKMNGEAIMPGEEMSKRGSDFSLYSFPADLPEILVADMNTSDKGVIISHSGYDINLRLSLDSKFFFVTNKNILKIERRKLEVEEEQKPKANKDTSWRARLRSAMPLIAGLAVATGIGIWAYKNPNRLSEFFSGLYNSSSSFVTRYLNKIVKK